jgi:hypothetical protein
MINFAATGRVTCTPGTIQATGLNTCLRQAGRPIQQTLFMRLNRQKRLRGIPRRAPQPAG